MREEFQSISKADVPFTEGPHFSKVDNIIKESMRIYPAGWAWTRVALEDDKLKDHDIHAGEIVFISPYLTQRSSKYWKKPEDFYPDRFESEVVKGSYIPFGYGPRTCMGMSLAMIEMRIMLKQLVLHFEIIDCNHTPVIRPQITLDALNGIKVGLKKRPE